MQRLRYIGNNSGIIEGLNEIPEEVAYEKGKFLVYTFLSLASKLAIERA